MSQSKLPVTPPKTPSAATVASAGSLASVKLAENECCQPDFIYGGPFIKVEKPSPFLNTATPINLQLQGTFKKSFAYYSLKERLPIILTKVIDYCSREGNQIKASNGASDEELRGFIRYVTKLKNDLMTNKKYDLLTVDTAEAKRWNRWIEACQYPYYFTNTWVFSECYVYRRLREGCELSKGLQNFDPFEAQKNTSFTNSIELMCIVADKFTTMLPKSEKDKRKADFITLLKLCLWANKCDLSLSAGEQVGMGGGGQSVIDPFQMILDFKDKLLVDDTGKIADQVVAKAEAIAKAIDAPQLESPRESGAKSPPSPPAPPAAPPAEGEEAPKVPCPAKMVIPQTVNFDIVCDNAGYELFADLCVGHFLVAQGVVQKVRFHVKRIPWFVSDVTQRDFKYVIDSCAKANYNREIPSDPKPEPAEGEAPPEAEPPRVINADNLRQLGETWSGLVEDGTFLVLSDEFWTSPHVYKDMKAVDPGLYRKLQFAAAILFKGDLNYRKLLGERNCNPVLGFEPALQGFIPAPIIAARTVKADLICGLPRGKQETLNKLDDKWMQTGDYGVIQYCAKGEALKVSDRPCVDYGATCYGVTCPVHTDI